MKASMRFAVVMVAICSWFTISNHCAFAALAANSRSVQTRCPFHSKPKEKQSTGAQCCKILRATTPVPTKSWARDDAKLTYANGYCDARALAITSSQMTLVPLCFGTGPPDADSFAELILQRSLRAHAPPIVA
jgi:hypothetical protein